MNIIQRFFHRPFFIRLLNWEYWPFAVVYSPILPVWLLLSIRARSFFFFNASNPGIENGGFLNESKKDIHNILPDHLYPQSMHYSLNTDPEFILRDIEKSGLSYPLFAKPDIGGKGRGVKKIHLPEELLEYVKTATLDFHIQELVPYENEVGIFYYRYPSEEKGRISGIVRKEFLSVTGNGFDTCHTLLMKDKRAIMYIDQLKESLGADMHSIPIEGEKKIVSPYGNHARGSMFIDDSTMSDEFLVKTLDSITKQIPGFYYGRLDIRFRDWDSLRKGENFKLIEVNGAGSEPTHIYDPSHSILFAWKEIIRHWWIMTTISIQNHKKGISYLSFREGNEMLRINRQMAERLAKIPA